MAKLHNIPEALTYDDVLLTPRYSQILPTDVRTTTQLGHLELEVPFLSAPMDTVTESRMAIAMAKAGALGVIHKNMTAKKQAAEVAKVVAKGYKVGGAVSVSDEQFERACMLVEAGAEMLIVDSAHGHSKGVLSQIKRLKKKFKKGVVIVGGNVASYEGTKALIEAGADVVKIGVGPGSICTTRIVAGVGVPQLTAVMEGVRAAKKTGTPIIADGGIKYSGDIVKALAAGASAVMAGGLFSATLESPGKMVTVGGKKMKTYRGMGSVAAMQQGSKDRYGQKGVNDTKKLVAEGIVGYKEYKGKVGDIVFQLAGGVRNGMGYHGAKNLKQLAERAKFVRMTAAGRSESHPHTLDAMEASANYKA